MDKPTLDKVRQHYDAFPYPEVTRLAVPLPLRVRRDQISWLLGRKPDQWIGPDCDIWIAGCGTQQALQWGLSFPDARILATDVSDIALGRSRDLAAQLGLSNIHFDQLDLLKSPHEEKFDLVVCTGVMNHLSDALAGLKKLRQAMRPGGALQLGFNNPMRRGPLLSFRTAVQAMSQPTDSPETLFNLAMQLLEAQIHSERCSPPSRHLFQSLWEARHSNRSRSADALIHPQEILYDPDAIMGLLAASGLQKVNWRYPACWNPENYIESAELLARFGELKPDACHRAIYQLAGLSGPPLELLAIREDAEKPDAFEVYDFLQMYPLCASSHRIYEVEQNRVLEPVEVPAWRREEGLLVGPCEGTSWNWRIPDSTLPVLEACDGSRSMRQLLGEFSSRMSSDEVFLLLQNLSPMEIGLVTFHP